MAIPPNFLAQISIPVWLIYLWSPEWFVPLWYKDSSTEISNQRVSPNQPVSVRFPTNVRRFKSFLKKDSHSPLASVREPNENHGKQILTATPNPDLLGPHKHSQWSKFTQRARCL
jgi:hypothetical protein